MSHSTTPSSRNGPPGRDRAADAGRTVAPGRFGLVLVVVLVLAGCGRSDLDIIFTTDRYGTPDLYSMNTWGLSGDPEPVIGPINGDDPAWSPDGSRIAFVSDRGNGDEIYTVRPDGTGRTQVTSGTEDLLLDPLWSPDGDRIAFRVSRKYDDGLYTIRPDGTGRVRIAGIEGRPAWSPDGSRIAFASFEGEKYTLYSAAADGSGEKRRITERPAQDPTWSPDGSRIAYVSRFGADSSDIYIARVEGSTTRLTNTPDEEKEQLRWSPDGARIAFVSDKTIYTIQADGTGRQHVSRRNVLTEYAWSPDGSQIAYVDYDSKEYGATDEDEIHVATVNEKGGGKQLTTNTGRKPAWSPDGSRIAFVSDRTGTDELYTMRTDGTEIRRVRKPRAWYATNPVFSRYSPLTAPYPSSRPRVAFTSNRSGNDDIYTVVPGTRNLTQITDHSAADTDPTWAPDRLRLAFASTRDGASNVYTIGLDGADPKPVTDHEAADTNPAWGASGWFASRIAFVSNRDGNVNLYTIAPDGSGLTQITDHEATDTDPAWAPGGARIAFASDREGSFNLYTIAPDGTGLRQVTDHDSNDTDPAWGPHGERIAFVTDQDGNADIYEINADGTRRRFVTDDEAADTGPTWGLTEFERYLWDIRKRAVQ